MIDIVRRLFSRRRKTEPEPIDPLDTLGLYRSGIVWALRAKRPGHAFSIERPHDRQNIYDLYESYAMRIYPQLQKEEDRYSRSMAGALKLTIGDLSGAEWVLDNLPPKRVDLDHGAGRALLVPAGAILHFLPLPEDFPDWLDLIAGSEAEARVRTWLVEHRDRLEWAHDPESPDQDRYVLRR